MNAQYITICNAYLNKANKTSVYKENLGVKKDSQSVTSLEAMYQYETNGKHFTAVKDPKTLNLLMQGKRLTDWHIKNYRDSISQGEFLAWEFINNEDITINNYLQLLVFNNKYKIDWKETVHYNMWDSPLKSRLIDRNIPSKDRLYLINLILNPYLFYSFDESRVITEQDKVIETEKCNHSFFLREEFNKMKNLHCL